MEITIAINNLNNNNNKHNLIKLKIKKGKKMINLNRLMSLILKKNNNNK